jgi:hypothetical protein
MRPILLRLLFLALPLAVVAGCTSGGQLRGCEGNTDYLQAVDRPPLRLPPDIVPTERMKPLEIPAADPNPNTLDPVPACLDQPPRFFARKGAVADPAEDVVRAWAAAWATRKPDVVLQAYSAAFQPPDGGGSGPYLDQRRTQVTSGPAPEPKLEDVTVATAGADRRVVTFVQRFGDGALRKELTLAREPAGWRIVAERTLEVL